MKSSSGAHYVGLDHVRAVAAFMVFVWHFTHFATGYPVAFEGAPFVFPMALLDEGHTGVALFMVLSGYLFAKLLNGRSIDYGAFFWNRFLRLGPLLILVFVISGAIWVHQGQPLLGYLKSSLIAGLIKPRWPGGAWSITVEMHFYIALPLLLYLSRRWKFAPIVAVAGMVGVRTLIYLIHGQVQDASYWTIIGRADDFLLGIAAFSYRDSIKGRHVLALATALCFCAFFWFFDYLGGYYQSGSNNPIWIILPTTEAIAYSLLVAYYDSTYRPVSVGASRFLSQVGDYSYAIYLLHPFFVFRLADLVHRNVMDISNFYVACAWAVVGFALMIPIGYLSYSFFELPFLQLRKVYIRSQPPAEVSSAAPVGDRLRFQVSDSSAP